MLKYIKQLTKNIMKNIITAAVASIALVAPSVQAAPDFYSAGVRAGNQICSTYNRYDSFENRVAVIEGAFYAGFLSDPQIAALAMRDGDLTNYQENQMALGLMSSLSSRCPQSMTSIMNDGEYAF